MSATCNMTASMRPILRAPLGRLRVCWLTRRDLSCTHERGHGGNPYNELADALCTQLAESPRHSDSLSEYTPANEFTMNSLMAQWAFVMMLDQESRQQYPVEISSGSFFLCSAACPVAEWGLPSSVLAAHADDFQSADRAALFVPVDAGPAVHNLVQVNPCTLRLKTKRQL